MAHRTQLRARPDQHFIYAGRCVVITDLHGAIPGGGTEGVYVDDTRILSRHSLAADGTPLRAFSASPVSGARFLSYLDVPSETADATVIVTVARVVGEGMREELRIENHDRKGGVATLELRLDLDADFADIIEPHQGKRLQEAGVDVQWDEQRRELSFVYRHPELRRAAVVRVDRAPGGVRCEGRSLSFPLEIGPHDAATISLAVEPLFDGHRRTAPGHARADPTDRLERLRRRLRDEAPQLVTTNATVSRAWRTAVDDLASLPLGLEEGPATPIAGLPLYQQFFGRDSLTIGWQALLAMSEPLRDSLRANAAWQGKRIDDWLDEEPGKMIHQARLGPISVLGLDPFVRYYGDWATVPDFLIMLGQYLAWTNDVSTVRELLGPARRAIDWVERYGDLDGDGFLEYTTRSEKGVKNQGWKDSEDGIVDEHGEVVENPIAASEIQAYWYAGLQQAAFAFFLAGDRSYAASLLGKARDLKARFDRAFWMPDDGFYALALGPDKRQVRSIASNAGHLLATGIVPRQKGPLVARRLMEPDMFSGWGIRTLSADHPAYNPFSYHLGTVWPVENATIALGLARYGCIEELHRLAEGIFASTDLFVENRLPEALGGLPRDERHPHPGVYPKSNEPQGWSASMIVLLVQVLLGIRPVAPLRSLIVDPQLPPWLPDVRLEGIRVADARAVLDVRRTEDGKTRYRVGRLKGGLRVIRQPPPDARSTSATKRARALVGSFFPFGSSPMFR